MKTLTSKSFAIVLFLAPLFSFAQSGCSTSHASNAVSLSAQASGEALGAVGDSAQGSVRVVSGVAAVPVMMSGAVVSGAGQVSGALGEAAGEAGEALWDFATSDPATRPSLDKNAGLPAKKPAAPAPTAPAADVSPAEAMKAATR